MGNLRFLLLAVLCVGVAQINSTATNAKVPDDDPALFKNLPQIGPRVQMKFLPGLLLPARPISTPQLQGQLLTPRTGCGASQIGLGKIVGGTPARNSAYPWMALVGYVHGQEISFNCGGSLITSRHVLSAAHCINRQIYMVRLGEHDLTTTFDGKHDDIRLTRAVPHAQYNAELMLNDIAILYMNRDVNFNDRIKPVCLPLNPPMRTKTFTGTNPFVAGWGTTSENGQQSSILMHVQVPVISNRECLDKYSRIGVVQSTIQFGTGVICAGHTYGGADSCQGDSGGPLMLPVHEDGKFPFYQIGVVSYGIGCARPNIPGVYTNVQAYIDWIRQHLH